MLATRHPFALTRIARHTLVAVAMLAALPPAIAQNVAPPPAGVARQTGGDPPSRVARLNYLSGAVTTEPAGASDWSYAAVNRPLTTGDQLWNDSGARSELHIGSTAVRLGQSTSLSILNLDDANTQLKVPLGTLSTHVRELPPGTSYEIDTPNLALAVGAPGDYRVDVAPDGSSTTVTVRRGSATVYGDGTQMPVSAGQRVVFTGTALQVADTGAVPPPDGLDEWVASRDAAEERSVSARYVSREIPGYQDLDANGTWRENPDYGEVWVPSAVPAGWAPYRTGHWIWQAPWGWTWVDDEPWGFAPYHYGRWAYVDDSWAWVPGPLVVSAPPCYAPALVAFVGGGGGGFDWSVGLAIGGIAAAGVAWFPLGPRDPWRPSWGGWSPHYYQHVNQTVIVNNVNNINVNKTVNVTNITNITNIHNTYVNFRAPNAVTAVPATAFVHGQPVSRFAQKVDPQQWRNAHIGSGAPGVAPVRQSFTGALRNAAYRPPAAVAQRSIVATRNPAVPAAYHDQLAAHLAQSGARVPGAGAPVVKTAVPPNYAMRPVRTPENTAASNRWAMRNVQLVDTRSSVAQPERAPQAGAGNPAARAGERPQPNMPQPNAAQPNAAQPNIARPGQPQPGVAQPTAPHAPGTPPNAMRPDAARPNEARPAPAPSARNGVPRPPAAVENPGMRDEARAPGEAPRPQPSWTQPHPPIQQQRANEGGPRANGEPNARSITGRPRRTRCRRFARRRRPRTPPRPRRRPPSVRSRSRGRRPETQCVRPKRRARKSRRPRRATNIARRPPRRVRRSKRRGWKRRACPRRAPKRRGWSRAPPRRRPPCRTIHRPRRARSRRIRRAPISSTVSPLAAKSAGTRSRVTRVDRSKRKNPRIRGFFHGSFETGRASFKRPSARSAVRGDDSRRA
ncbi:fecR family protein [Burkholderia pseudomallei MSHR640]|nr:fecR family protein [Burkholderia pseudomallei MSHR640]